jgi:putative transposase
LGFTGRTLKDLNEAFDLWLNELYHQRIHSATGQTPFKRFTSNLQCLRAAPADLLDHFRQTARRRVAKDRTVVLNGRLYEAPVALIGRQVELLYHAADPDRVEIRFAQKSYGIVPPVNLYVNCRVKRDRNSNIDLSADPARRLGGSLFQGRTCDE